MRIHWRAAVATAVGLASAGGCHYGLHGRRLDSLPEVAAIAAMTGPSTAAPAKPGDPPPAPPAPAEMEIRTVYTSQLAERPITLTECFALAAQFGRLGQEGSVQVFAVDPALAKAAIDEAVARFDPRLQGNALFGHNETATDNSVLNFDRDAPREIKENTVTSSLGLVRPLPHGGLGNITTRLDYRQTEPASPVNPAYTPGLSFAFEQPLLQGAGRRINQLLPVHPSGQVSGPALLFAFNGYEQTDVEFQRRLQDVLFTVAQAYWNLYSAYVVLYSREVALQSLAAQLEGGQALLEANRLTVTDLAQIEVDYWQFRSERVRALGNGFGSGVQEAERQLRLALGLPAEDGTRLVPADVPVTAPLLPDWRSAVGDALAARPELVRAGVQLAGARLAVERDANALLPNLALTAGYDVTGFGRRLDGSGDTSAGRNLFNQPADSARVGLRLDFPIGFRAASARYRQAVLSLHQQQAALQFQQDQMLYSLQRAYRQLAESRGVYEAQRSRRRAATKEVNARLEQFRKGLGLPLNLLVARRNWADALRDEFVALAEYNTALAEFERQKGTLTRFSGVVAMHGPCDTRLAALSQLPTRPVGATTVVTPPPTDPEKGVPEVDDPIPVPLLFPDGISAEPRSAGDPGKLPPPRPLADPKPAGPMPDPKR